MDLKDLKKITAYARRAGLKSLRFNGIEIEFKESTLSQKPKRAIEELAKPEIKEPTLEQINEYIYGNVDEAS